MRWSSPRSQRSGTGVYESVPATNSSKPPGTQIHFRREANAIIGEYVLPLNFGAQKLPAGRQFRQCRPHESQDRGFQSRSAGAAERMIGN
jgi:hypothetical protein